MKNFIAAAAFLAIAMVPVTSQASPIDTVNSSVGSVLNYAGRVVHLLNPSLGPCTDSNGKAFPADACARYQRIAAHELALPNVDTSPAYFNRFVEIWGRQGD